jgi:hypothetical protein
MCTLLLCFLALVSDPAAIVLVYNSSDDEMLTFPVIQLVLCLYALYDFLQKPRRKETGRTRVWLLVVSFAIWTFYSAAALIDSWNIIGVCAGAEDTYPLWSLGMSTGMTLAYIVLGDCLMVRGHSVMKVTHCINPADCSASPIVTM